ncbi:DUF5320 domain-containing protein [Caldicellulosiruptoraceae bacterium PP1]
MPYGYCHANGLGRHSRGNYQQRGFGRGLGLCFNSLSISDEPSNKEFLLLQKKNLEQRLKVIEFLLNDNKNQDK